MFIRTAAGIATVLTLVAPAFAETVDIADAGNTGAKSAGSAVGAVCNLPYGQTDADTNGFVSDDEWAAWETSAFSAMDANSDNRISREEFASCMGAHAGMAEALGDRTRATLRGLDIDRNGSIDLAEFRAAAETARTSGNVGALRRYVTLDEGMTDESIAGMSAAELKTRTGTMFASLDSDGSGALSQAEWGGTTPAAAGTSDWAEALFDQMDADGSGTLSQAEFSAGLEEQYNNAALDDPQQQPVVYELNYAMPVLAGE